jgi:hypothetical protein
MEKFSGLPKFSTDKNFAQASYVCITELLTIIDHIYALALLTVSVLLA